MNNVSPCYLRLDTCLKGPLSSKQNESKTVETKLGNSNSKLFHGQCRQSELEIIFQVREKKNRLSESLGI